MTRQIPDGMEYENNDFVILYGPAQFGFDVHDHTLFPVGRNTANHRGYWCEYSVNDNRLTLDELHVNNGADYYPCINGVEAVAPSLEMAEVTYITDVGFEKKVEERLTNSGYHVYRDIGLALDFSGVATIGRSRVALSSYNIGYPEPWTFGTVLELEFEDGVLKGVSDISDSFIAKREEEARRDAIRWD